VPLGVRAGDRHGYAVAPRDHLDHDRIGFRGGGAFAVRAGHRAVARYHRGRAAAAVDYGVCDGFADGDEKFVNGLGGHTEGVEPRGEIMPRPAGRRRLSR